jgi:hypothetical protein
MIAPTHHGLPDRVCDAKGPAFYADLREINKLFVVGVHFRNLVVEIAAEN